MQAKSSLRFPGPSALAARGSTTVVLIFAIGVCLAAAVPGGEDRKAAGAGGKKADLPPPPKPVYDLPRNARDPFMLPGERILSPSKKSAEKQIDENALRRAVRVSLIVAGRGRGALATVNGRMLRPGDSLTVKIGDSQATLVCRSIQDNPPEVVFFWKEKKKEIGIGLFRP